MVRKQSVTKAYTKGESWLTSRKHSRYVVAAILTVMFFVLISPSAQASRRDRLEQTRWFFDSIARSPAMATLGVGRSILLNEEWSDPFFSHPGFTPAPIRQPVRGAYVSAWVASSSNYIDKYLEWVDQSELNAIVIDVKDDYGRMTYTPSIPELRQLHRQAPILRDMPGLISKLRTHDVYSIARMVTFKDRHIVEQHPEWAVKRISDGGIWRDRKSDGWIDPYNREAWAYLIKVAKDAALQGFKEIQFDYIRFPTDGNTKDLYYPANDGASRTDTIMEFLAYARKELAPYNVAISVDIFGLITSVKPDFDMGIGQSLEKVARYVDYVSPMVYPSHYGPYNYGYPDPDKEPYGVVRRAMEDAIKRLQAVPDNRTIIRPWLQDFSLRNKYGPDEVRKQIDAVYDVGLNEYLLWDPNCRYNRGAVPGK